MLALVALGAFVATSVAGVVLGGIQGFIFEDTGWSRSSIGLAAGLGVWASGLFGPIVGRLTDRYGARWLIPSGTAILGICLFSFIWVHSIWQFFLVAIVARAVSQPLLIGIVPRSVAVNFFRRRRNMALALTTMFRPVSGAINIQIFSSAAVAIGWRTTFQLLGIFSMLLTVPMIMIIRRQPEDIGLLPDGERPRLQVADPSVLGPHHPAPAREQDQEESWSAREALKTKSYWLLAFTILMFTMASTGISFNIVPYTQENTGLSSAQAIGVLSLSTALALGNPIWGYVSNTVNPRYSVIAVTVFMALLIIYLSIIQSAPAAYTFGILWGIGMGGLEVLTYVLLARYFGRASFGSITGAIRPFEAAGLGLGPILGGAIFDLTGTYHGLFIASISGFIVAGVLLFLAVQPTKP